MYVSLLRNLKDVHCATFFFANRAQNLSEASPLVVLSRQSLHSAIEKKHSLLMLRWNLFFQPKLQNIFYVTQELTLDTFHLDCPE